VVCSDQGCFRIEMRGFSFCDVACAFKKRVVSTVRISFLCSQLRCELHAKKVEIDLKRSEITFCASLNRHLSNCISGSGCTF
jgi:hypothetical protein